MIADWIGAGEAQGKPDTPAWYKASAHKMTLHPHTRCVVESYMQWMRLYPDKKPPPFGYDGIDQWRKAGRGTQVP
jgi:hypothetical protein